MRYILGLIVLTVVTGIIWGSYNLGAFKEVQMTKEAAGPFLLYGLRHEGAYYEISKKILEVETWARENGLPCEETFGLYIEDPHFVENERLLSNGGCLTGLENLDLVRSKQSLMPKLEIIQIPQGEFIKGLFEGSPWIGPYKVYSKAGEFSTGAEAQSIFPALEIYRTDKINIQTTYFFGVKFEALR